MCRNEPEMLPPLKYSPHPKIFHIKVADVIENYRPYLMSLSFYALGLL
jgi:hypothetical protein